MRPAFILCVLLASGMAMAAPPKKPAAKFSFVTEDMLFTQLKKAQSPEEARPIEEKILGMFRASGSASVDLLMTRAQGVAAADKDTARRLVESVTKIAPGYAEGWRTLAALQNGAGDDGGALVSLQKAVQLNPRHFMALNELGSMLEDYGDKAGALKLYRRAHALDPQMEGAARHIKALTQTVEGRDI
jgi:tetratricopeptide (TPR) repeat protein